MSCCHQLRWAFFARKFDNSLESSQLKVGGSQMSLISFGGGMLRGLSGQAVQSKCSQNVDKRNLAELCEFEIVLTLR